MPISYEVRYLRDNLVARLSFTTDYEAETCVGPTYLKPARVTIDKLEFHNTADDDEDIPFWVNIELLRQNGTVARELLATRGETYVEEIGKIGRRENKTIEGEGRRRAMRRSSRRESR